MGDALMTLSEIAERLGVAPRRVQYLTERGVFTPSSPSDGRGKYSKYSSDDLKKLRVLLVDLDGAGSALLKKISSAIVPGETVEIVLGKGTKMEVTT